MNQSSTLRPVFILLIIVGLALRFWINQRRFNRRAMTGLEGFSSYGASLIIRFLEKIGMSLSVVFILVGVVGSVGACGWIKTNPFR